MMNGFTRREILQSIESAERVGEWYEENAPLRDEEETSEVDVEPMPQSPLSDFMGDDE